MPDTASPVIKSMNVNVPQSKGYCSIQVESSSSMPISHSPPSQHQSCQSSSSAHHLESTAQTETAKVKHVYNESRNVVENVLENLDDNHANSNVAYVCKEQNTETEATHDQKDSTGQTTDNTNSPPMTYLPTPSDTMSLHLDKQNMVTALLPNREKIITLFDSGATQSLLCSKFVQNSHFLSQLPKTPIQPIRFRVGNGDYLTANYAITFKCSISSHEFEITATVVNVLGGINLVIGNRALEHIEAKLDFNEHKITFKRHPIRIYPQNDVQLQPGQTKMICVSGRMPKTFMHAQGKIKATARFTAFMPRLMLVQFHAGCAKIAITNPYHTVKRISRQHAIATFSTSSVLHTYNIIQSVDKDSEATTFNYYSALKPTLMPKIDNQPHDSTEQADSTTRQITRKELFQIKKRKFPFLEPDDQRLTMFNDEIITRDVQLTDSMLDSAKDSN